MRTLRVLACGLLVTCAAACQLAARAAILVLMLLMTPLFAKSAYAHAAWSAGESGSCGVESVSTFLGTYRVASVKRIGGGITSGQEAEKQVGQEIAVTPEKFSTARGTSITKPRYALSCYPAIPKEGDVPKTVWGAHWSNFYGAGLERTIIVVLEVHDPADSSEVPTYWFEVVFSNGAWQLWDSNDGWLYQMDRVPAVQARVEPLAAEQVPDEQQLQELVGGATVKALGITGYEPTASVFDRILDGFEAASRVMATEDGQTIVWGFKYKEANLQSVVIADASGQLQLAAIVTDVHSLTRDGTNAITTEAAYWSAVEHLALHPDVVLFVRDQAALNTAYPLFKRWMDANLLGFNRSCQAQAAACALLPNIRIPTRAYLPLKNGGALTKVVIPTLPAIQIPLEKFTQ